MTDRSQEHLSKASASSSMTDSVSSPPVGEIKEDKSKHSRRRRKRKNTEPQGENKPLHTKRTTVALDDGWSLVTHTSTASSSPARRQRNSNQNKNKINTVAPQKPSKTDSLLASARPTALVPGLTVSKLKEEFKDYETKFRASDFWERLKEIVKKKGIGKIEKAVCLGVGSLSLEWENQRRAIWQMVLFIAVLALVSGEDEGKDKKMKVYAQEPLFTDLDKEFLRGMGYEIRQDNAADFITDASFVYAPFLDWQILLPKFLKERDPLLFIGNEVLGEYDQYKGSVRDANSETVIKECNDIGKQFLRTRKGVKVPDFELHTNALHGMMVYFKDQEAEKE